MVQVTNGPYDEKQPILEKPDGQNVSDDIRNSRMYSVAEEAYKGVASSMMADPINITNPSIALSLLETSLRNRNVPLAKHCISNLNQHIQKDNALKVMLSISRWLYTPEADYQLTNFEPSAPPLVDNDYERNDYWMKEPLDQLRQKCLLEIDKDGDAILKEREIQDLHYQDLLAITTRDSLLVSSELIVYSAIMRWCMEECKRKGLTTENTNLKAVLRDLIHAPRYGLMNKREFLIRAVDGNKGPDRIGILEEDEINLILEYIKQREKKKKVVKELPYKMSLARRGRVSKNETIALREKCILNCLTCWTVVFD